MLGNKKMFCKVILWLLENNREGAIDLSPWSHCQAIDMPKINAIIKIGSSLWKQDCAKNVLSPIACSKRNIGKNADYD